MGDYVGDNRARLRGPSLDVRGRLHAQPPRPPALWLDLISRGQRLTYSRCSRRRVTVAAVQFVQDSEVVEIDVSCLVTGVEQTLRGDGHAGDRDAGQRPVTKEVRGNTWNPPSRAACRAVPSSSMSSGCRSAVADR